MEYCIGIDLGGTNIKAAAYRLESYEKVGEKRLPTQVEGGWEHVLDNVGYSYFRKPAAQMQGREEIFCDEASRMEMFRRILCHRMLPLLILLVGMFVPLIIMELLEADSAADALAIGIPAGLVVVLYIAVFAQCVLQYIHLHKGR